MRTARFLRILILYLALAGISGCEDQVHTTPDLKPKNYGGSNNVELNKKLVSADKQKRVTQGTAVTVNGKVKFLATESGDFLQGPFKPTKAPETGLRKLISEIPSAAGGGNKNYTSGDNSKSSASSPVMVPPQIPKEIADKLEEARDNKALTEAINAAFAESRTNGRAHTRPSANSLLNNSDATTLSSTSSYSSQSGAQSHRFNPGVRVPNSQSSTGPDITSSINGTFNFDDDNSDPPSSDSESLPLLSGQARGYSMFYLMHPRARATVEKQITTLIKANIKEVYLGVLTDGTFGKDFLYLQSVLTRLANEGRIIYLALYLTNGPTMRAFDESPIQDGFNGIEPSEFRELIISDQETRNTFRSMAKEVFPTFSHNKQLNPLNKNIAVVMLEDNLDVESYKAMRDIAQEVFGNLVQFVRNPCPGCYPGNDSNSIGDPLELHLGGSMGELTAGDGFSFDGHPFLYPEESGEGIPFDLATGLAVEARQRNLSYFGIWRSEWQGLGGGPLVHPDNRIYAVPSDNEADLDITLLRYGL